ncbi:MAG: Na+/H+ antiporter subunit E [Gammaproteobacteria bacterium]
MTTRRWLPHPQLSLLLAVVWLLLVNSLAPAHILLAMLISLIVPLFTDAFWPVRPHVRYPQRLLRYALMVIWDIVRANLIVARLILGPPTRLRPAFVRLPLELRSDFAITVLAGTVSMTPGTVSAEISADRRVLLIHVLDLDDEAALLAEIKARYETPLKEIFEGET